MKTITRYKFRYATQKCARHNTMQIHKACANRQKELYIDQCFRSLLDLLHESRLISEKKGSIIQSLELNTFKLQLLAHENNNSLPQTQKTISFRFPAQAFVCVDRRFSNLLYLSNCLWIVISIAKQRTLPQKINNCDHITPLNLF